MKNENAIEIRDISKKFSKNINAAKKQLKVMFFDTLFSRDASSELAQDEFYALKNIFLEIKKNEKLAILGPNGSGKSTLLKMLNGIYMPDAGEIEIRGAISSILELSTGFNQELSGRENIYLKFALQGKSKESVDEIIDDVISFSGLEEFMQTPLKNYSSGMKSKLGFAIVTSLEPEILILDEVFAAGDKEFRKKSEVRIKELYTNTTTILVSHSMNIVRDIADRVIVLEKGKLVFDGETKKGIAFYENMMKPKVIRKKVFSSNRYSVVTTIYNAEKYLDEYFNSIVNQTLDFEKHIDLILVDDGSIDNSAEIIKKYQNQFPNNITYIKQEHKGKSASRNSGMKYVKTPWVTFIDAEDKVNDIYFEEVDRCVVDDESIGAVSCNKMYYLEDTLELKKTNLSNRFNIKKKVVNPANMQYYMETSVSSIFFKNILLQKYRLLFNEKTQPVFGDGCFTNEFFLKAEYNNIVFLGAPEYYHKCKILNALIVDKTWQETQRYLNSIEYGLLELCKKAMNEYGFIPIYIQRYVLYQIQPYFKRVIDDKDELLMLTQEERGRFENLLNSLFTYLDSNTIEISAFNGLSHKFKIGYYNLYKEKIMYNQVCYIDGYNYDTNELNLYYYFHSTENVTFTLNDKKFFSVVEEEVTKHMFLDQLFVYEKKITLLVKGSWEYFKMDIGTTETLIKYKMKEYKNGIQMNSIAKGKI